MGISSFEIDVPELYDVESSEETFTFQIKFKFRVRYFNIFSINELLYVLCKSKSSVQPGAPKECNSINRTSF